LRLRGRGQFVDDLARDNLLRMISSAVAWTSLIDALRHGRGTG
jgi:hypothetical protein